MPRRKTFSSKLGPFGLLVLLILAALYIAQKVNLSPGTILSPTSASTSAPASGSWYTLYFTDPDHPSLPGPDQPLAEAIRQAQQSVDVAAYSLSLASVKDALLEVHNRGVPVRIVMESDNMDGDVPAALQAAGIQILGDRREGLMHDKFIVIDQSQVWTGSMNFTTSGTYEDNNNLMQIRSSEIAQDYETEFNEMFVSDQFGPGSPSNTPYPDVTVDGTQLQVYFSPDDGVAAHLEEVLKGASHSIYFLAYSFTSNPLGEIIIERAQAGVTVGGVFETEQYRASGSEYNHFRAAGIDVRLDGNPGQMHHKVIIIDEQTVVFGSYNFTASADERNDENLIVVHDAQIAQRFLAEYQKVYNEAQP